MAGGAYRHAEQARTIGRRLGWDDANTSTPQPSSTASPAVHPTPAASHEVSGQQGQHGQQRADVTALPTHCWVVEMDGMPPCLPGLLLQWRR